jgi:two-component system cell cycle sensor histidine kinase/response regulator CckA
MASPSLLTPYRRSIVGGILLVGASLTLLLWQYAGRRDAERIRTGFLSRAQTQAAVASERLHQYEEMVYSLRDSFLGQQTVTREEFTHVAQSLLRRHAGVQALEWVQIVPHDQRKQLEEQATRELGRPFVVHRRLADNSLGIAPEDREYYVITYVEPLAGNEKVLGYDIQSAITAPQLNEARRTREFRASPITRLIQSRDAQAEPGVIFILPFSRAAPGSAVEGFVQGVFQVRTMLGLSNKLTTSEALDLYYFDVSEASAAPVLIYSSLGGAEQPHPADAALALPPLDDPTDFHQVMMVGNRTWRLVVRPHAAWVQRVATLQPKTILASGLAFTLLLALFVNSLLQRTSRIEHEVAERTRELRATELRLQAILDHAPAIIFVKDLEGRYQIFNQPFIDACPSDLRPLQGRTDAELFPAAEAARYREHDEQVLARGLPCQFEERATRANGKAIVSLVEKFPLLDDTGRPYALCGIATDITEHKAGEEHKLVLERRLLESQKLESLGVLAGGVAHDFNNILTAILGNANLASMELPDDHPVRPQLRQIEIASRRASDLCAQMLAYAGKAAFITTPVNLSSLVRDTAALLEATVGRRVRLELNTAAALPAVLGDATQLRQIVMNLVINAADAIGDRTDGTVEVHTFARELTPAFFATAVQSPERKAGTYVGLEVTDNGGGMNPEILKRIFEPFFTTKFSGRGLGLAAVLGIVQSHQGALFVESTPGKGTVFRLFLPASADQAKETGSPFPHRPAALRGTVLVVDDEVPVRLVALKALKAAGLQVIEAGDGQAALLTYRQRAADINLVLLDLTMPGLSGEETLRQLRALAPTLPVIVMSGYSEGETMGRCASLGVSGYLAKPFEISDLVTRLRPYLDKFRHPSA